ncbi:uncharacterized protein BDV14DRAFT_198399 [Aspergillus stella-maris]|uniref:uncharacterized protein n=1 Tax=Aspergillus stella-maris TaxID=1810926 RepID=UPI003CCDB104
MTRDDYRGGNYRLERRHFDDNRVRRARNPHPSYGYLHGPIPTSNSSFWKTVDNHGPAAATFHANNGRSVVSQIYALVCDVDLGFGGMCGQVFANSQEFCQHIEDEHLKKHGVDNGDTERLTKDEIVSGQNALKYWVLSRRWRKARYKSEPGYATFAISWKETLTFARRGPIGGFLDIFATACERIARNDPSFAERWGREFHRPLKYKPTNGPIYYQKTSVPPPALDLGPPIRKIHQATYNGPPGSPKFINPRDNPCIDSFSG